MAELYRGRVVGAEGFSKVLAIKRILPGFADDQAFVSMLIDEARVVANLSHPNIVQVFELGKDPAGYFIVMEFVNGPNLGALLKRLQEQGRALPEPVALDVIIAVLQALDFAHRLTDGSGRPQDLVHRDVSPQNVLVSDAGAVKLGDFGIAKATVRVAATTQAGSIKGKVPYMAPEQLRGEALDGRADQFAAGLVLWECLAGQRHYQGASDLELMRKVNDASIRPFSEVGVTVSAELDAILRKALAANPADRYATCAELARELTTYHRRTYPTHDPGALAALVQELFGEQLRALTERLRRFEAGEERPAGWAGAIEAPVLDAPALLTDPATLPSASHQVPPAEPITNAPHRRPSRAGLRRHTSPESAVEPPPRRQSRASSPAVPAAPAPSRTPVETPAVAPARAPSVDDAAIDAALAAEKAREASAKKKGTSPLALVAAFALAGGSVYVIGQLVSAGEQPAVSSTEGAAPRPMALPPPEPLRPPDDGEAAPPAAAPAPKADVRRTAAARPRKTEAASGHGTLDLVCKPECSIEIDGRDTGLTAPVKGIVLEAGRHRVKARNHQLNLSKTVTVEIQPGERTYREINLVLGP